MISPFNLCSLPPWAIASRHFNRHPQPPEIALVVEIAASSLEQDRMKARLYARAEIPVFWIVNLREARVEAYEEPSGSAPEPTYRRESNYGRGDIVPVKFGGKALAGIPVVELLP